MNLNSMKYLAALACGLVATVALFSGCDEIDEEDRFVGPLPFEIRKNVLVEDFTGQLCLNCPLAAEAVHGLQDTYGSEHVVTVAVHGGSLSLSEAQGGLATQQGNDYVSRWGVEAFPQGMVDRSGGLLEFQSWSGKVFERLQLPAAVGILLNNAYDAESRKLSIHASLTAAEDLEAANLQLWLTESDIVGFQRMPDGSMNREYSHQHVFRTVVNTDAEGAPNLTGDAVALEQGGQAAFDYEITLPEGWKPENMHIVAFVYDASGVLQTVEQAVVAAGSENE